MSDYTIRVIIEERHGRVVAEACVPMNPDFRETIQPLKVSDGPMRFFDTPPSVVHRVKADRHIFAQSITPAITKVLLDAMGAKDLFNGFTKAELKKFKEERDGK